MDFDEKLNTVVSRHEELKALLSESGISGQEFVKLSKEMASLDEIVEKAKEYKELKKNISEAKAIMSDDTMDAEMRKMGEEEYYDLKEKLPVAEKQIKILLIPKDDVDSRNAILEIRAGTGGEEAALFAAGLFRMYEKYAMKNGWKFEVMNISETGIGGYKEAVASVSGKDVFAKLKFESGAHRVQRVPETESAGRVHTSAATVAVLPEAEEVDVKINEADIKMDTFRASGAGGQHVNKTDSAVRLTHIPTGTVVECQEERSQFKNRDKAMARLRSHIYEAERQRINNEMSSNRKDQVGSGDRSERIRTYNFPQGRVTDHRINLTLYKIDEVMEGEALDEIILALVESDQLEKLALLNG